MRHPVLVATAVGAERDAIVAGLPSQALTVAAVGVGPASAAAGTARLLALAEAAGHPYGTVISAGIAGGFAGRAPVGAVVLASRSIQADLGADSPDGFLPIDRLDFGDAGEPKRHPSGDAREPKRHPSGDAGEPKRHLSGDAREPKRHLSGTSSVPADAALLAALRIGLPGALVGDVITVATVTGTAARAAALAEAHPAALAEAMEGYGVACAAAGAGADFAELRTISNVVGPRDRSAWRIGEALAALTTAAASLG